MSVQFFATDGAEVHVSSTTGADVSYEKITSLAGGGFVLTWESYGPFSDGGIHAQIYDAAGAAIGDPVWVDRTGYNDQFPSVAATPDGGFLITWNAYSAATGADIVAQRYDSSGSAVGNEFRINSTLPGQQFESSIASTSDGGFVVTWLSDQQQQGNNLDIYAQRYDAAGAALGGEFQVNTATSGTQSAAAIAALKGGGFVVTWESLAPDGSGSIYAQLYGSDGVAIGNGLQVSNHATSDQSSPTVTSMSDGGFVVSWVSVGQNGDGSSVYAQRYDASGTTVGSQFEASGSDDYAPSVAALADGGFVLSWSGYGANGWGIYAQAMDASGALQGGAVHVDKDTTWTSDNSKVTALANGGFAVSWITYDLTAGHYNIEAQSFAPTTAGVTDLSLSNSSLSEAAIDGLPIANVDSAGAINSGSTYQIVADSTGGAFAIDGTRLVVEDSSKLDAATSPTATIRIESIDANGQVFEKDFSLSVQGAHGDARLTAGEEFQVSTPTENGQRGATTTVLKDGGFVLAWSTTGPDGTEIYAQRYDSSGAALGSQVHVNSTSATGEYAPTVTGLSDGGFVVAWQDSASGIYAQRFASSGAPAGSEFQVNATNATGDYAPSISQLANGGFVVAWQDGSSGIHTQQYDSAGVKVGAELVAAGPGNNDYNPTVASLADGGFVLCWQSYGVDSDYSGAILAQRYNSSGAAVGPQFEVNRTTAGDQTQPTVTGLADGGFVVSWTSAGQDGNGLGIFAQRYDASGAAVGGEFQVNSSTLGDQNQPSIAALDGGGWVITWSSWNGTNNLVYAQRYDSAGHALGGEDLVSATNDLGDYLESPRSVGALPGGGFEIAFENYVNVNDQWTENVSARMFNLAPQHGVVADGYISGATVFFDSNANGLLDPGEVRATTDAKGHFTITPASGPLVAIGGTNVDTGIANTVAFSAPGGATVINPLTTLVQALVSEGLSVADASTRVATTLGLGGSINLLSFDALASSADPQSLVVQKAAAAVVEILDAAQKLSPGTEAAAVTALATEISASTSTLSLSDPVVITNVLQAGAPTADVSAAVIAVATANASIADASSVAGISTIQGDVTPPTAPNNLADAGIVNGYVNALHDTADQLLTGSAESGSEVTIYDGATRVGTVTADQSGLWTYTLGVLGPGPHSLTATATDAAGNVSTASGALSFNVDTTAPNGPTVGLANDTGISSTDRLTSNATLIVSSAEPGGSLSYKVDNGTWNSTYNPAALLDGQHTVAVTQTDAAGNVSNTSSITFTLDTRAPTAPTLALTTDTGSSSTDKITANPAITVTPSESGGSFSYKVDNGPWTSSLSTAGLSDGQHTVQATQTDAAGNVSPIGSITFNLDTTAPRPVLSSYSSTSTSSTFSGTSEAGSTVKIYDGSTLVGSAVTSWNGTWTLTTTALSNAVHNLSVKATDVAGNNGSSTGDNYIGTGSSDTLLGHATDDFLWGGTGNDTINGGAGNDRIIGAGGNDVMTGGTGADTFVFGPGFGNDVITDFTAGTDHLEISRSLFASTWSDSQIFSYIMTNSSSQGSGHNLVLKIDAGDLITLNNVTASSLHQSDFIFT